MQADSIDSYLSGGRRLARLLIPCGLLAGLLGCATLPTGPEPATVTAPEAEQPEPAVKTYPVAPFEGDSLYQLLAAEVAGYRGAYDFALEKYQAAAEQTRDPGVAARATRLALYLKQNDTALRLAKIWAEQDPSDVEAHRHAADLLLDVGRLEEAIGHMEAVKNLGGPARFDVFAWRSANLSSPQRASLLEAVSAMLGRHPGDEELMFAKAVLLEQSDRLEESLRLVDALLPISDDANVVVLRINILKALERWDEALLFLEARVAEQPDNMRLRLILARLLFERTDLDAARAQYARVLEQSPNDGDVLFALALIALEQKDDDEARRYLERMVRWDRRPGEAHYYLGGIAERRKDTATALAEYRQAGDGYEFIPAQARIAAILAAEDRLQEAREYLERLRLQRPSMRRQFVMIEAQLLADRDLQEEVFTLLDGALAGEPDNTELLYFRAMIGQRFDRLDILEADLRRIIALDPDNADALNALGYTLTDQTDRHEEALALIERALALRPDEAAFIDSMGWVQYRLNNHDEAIVHLRRALELFQNDEVAAHLGEVLWVVGERAEARRVWDEALKLAPDSEILKKVIRRFREN